MASPAAIPTTSPSLLALFFFILLTISTTITFAQHRQFSPTRPKSQQFKAAAASSPSASPSDQQQFMTAPQCRCKDLEECAKEVQHLVDKCKLEPKCEAHLKKVGNPQKIRQCLMDEQKDMEKLEECVEKRVGPIGCTNDEHVKNLTIPIVPEMMENGGEEGGNNRQRRRRQSALGSQQQQDWDFEDPDWTAPRHKRGTTVTGGGGQLPKQEEGHAPSELSDYLMCVDECTVQAASPDSAPKLCATREGNMSCAFKLKCALAPPDERQQKAFEDCEKQMQLTAQKRLKKSCQCLKAAGVKIVCPK